MAMLDYTEQTLYERVAESMLGMIRAGTFRPGDRVPSVRKLSRDLHVSVSTVVDAYRLLESRGVIHSRPQSGFFVRARLTELAPELPVTRPKPVPSSFADEDLVIRVLHDSANPRLIQFSAGVPNPEVLPLARLNRALTAATRKYKTRAHGYDFVPGWKPLREQIAQRLIASGCTLSPDEILTTCGCQEALSLALRAICKPGDVVAIESPTYYGLLQALELQGLRALEIPTDPRDGLMLDELESLLAQHPVRAILVTPNFGNPLGSLMPEESKRRLTHLAARFETPVIEDDIYGELAFSGRRPSSLMAHDSAGMVVQCSSFSKTIAPGFRVGWIVPGRYQREVERLKFASTVSTPTLPQMVLAEFLQSGGFEHVLRQQQKAYEGQIERFADAVTRHFPAGTAVSRPQGGYVLWVGLPKQIDTERLYDAAISLGVTYTPGVAFSAQGGYRNFLRLNASRWTDRTEEGLAILGQLMKDALV